MEEKTPRAGPIKTYEDLLVYQQAFRLALEVSTLIKLFPRYEQFELGRQLRASSRSVGANIAEGWAKRAFAAESKRHLVIALGECAETRHWISLAKAEGFASTPDCDRLYGEYSKLGMMIRNLWKEWRKLG